MLCPRTRLGRHIAGQLVRCGTSPGPNYEEGCAAESRADFVHKLSICLKELRESRFWIRLIIRRSCCRKRKWRMLDECYAVVQSDGQVDCHRKEQGRRRERSSSPSYILHFTFSFFIFRFSMENILMPSTPLPPPNRRRPEHRPRDAVIGSTFDAQFPEHRCRRSTTP